jgi:hypothetical protein
LKHHASSRFWKLYQELPAQVRDVADEDCLLPKTDPKHASLHFKRVGRLWSVRAGDKYRALGKDVEGGIQWFWIGSHNDYDNLVG